MEREAAGVEEGCAAREAARVGESCVAGEGGSCAARERASCAAGGGARFGAMVEGMKIGFGEEDGRVVSGWQGRVEVVI